MAVPNAQRTIATSAIVRKNNGTAVSSVGLKPKMTQRMNTSSPWIIATVAPPSVRPIIT
jgi:hypothetical protein